MVHAAKGLEWALGNYKHKSQHHEHRRHDDIVLLRTSLRVVIVEHMVNEFDYGA